MHVIRSKQQLTNHCKLRNITNTIALQTISLCEAKMKSSRTNAQGRGQGRKQGQNFGLEANLSSRT